MKIRIKGNSIRFRLTQSEVASLCTTGSVKAHTEFGPSRFGYAVQSDAALTQLQATFDDTTITLFIPASMLKDWDANSTVGFYHDMPLPSGDALSLTLEKDFACLDAREEDQSDNYPNPKAQL